MTVVTVGQVDTHFLSCLHLKAVHCLTGLRNIDLVVVLHNTLSPSVIFPESPASFLWKMTFLSANIALPKTPE